MYKENSLTPPIRDLAVFNSPLAGSILNVLSVFPADSIAYNNASDTAISMSTAVRVVNKVPTGAFSATCMLHLKY